MKRNVTFTHEWVDGSTTTRHRTVSGESESEIIEKVNRAQRISPHCTDHEIGGSDTTGSRPLHRSGKTGR